MKAVEPAVSVALLGSVWLELWRRKEDEDEDDDEDEDEVDDGTDDQVAAAVSVTASACRAGPAGAAGIMACQAVDGEPE